ncbi:hypothetical protein [Ornithinimicrobium sufpigmenti]|uniref:hypothetical protein n=1 Tax=Ornithinimicrobium sufpigmenti TaxID=2508882 RepID=UPI001035D608|nr:MULTISPECIES: hypothetical protein [unclassified Ornithinimicrobium]
MPGVTSARRRVVPDERTVGLSWLLQATSQGSLEASWRDLMALLQSAPLTYSHVADGVRHDAPADLVSVSEVSGRDFTAGRQLRFSALLALPGVYLRDTTFQTLDVPAGSSTHTVLAGSAPIIDAMVRWGPGPMAGPPYSLVDTTTGTGISSDFHLEFAGWSLTVAVGEMRSWTSSVTSEAVWHVTNNNRNQNIDYPGPGPLQLWPVVRESGGNLIREVRLQASHPCTIRYRRSWL